MAILPTYSSLEEKKEFFDDNNEFYIIDDKNKLDTWFNFYTSNFKKEHPVDFIFSGVSDAKYKLYTSSQRHWITDNMSQWKDDYSYKDFIQNLIDQAKDNPLIKKIFDLYDYSEGERDFPVLSLLQHYGAPTPLIDWSYNINCALFFAMDGIKRNIESENSISNYISIYSIHKKVLQEKRELLTLFDISNGTIPSFREIRDLGKEEIDNSNTLFIVSDFETYFNENYTGRLKVKTKKPITSLYNQNIIPQESLLMYNPFSDRSIEQLFNVKPNSQGQNLKLEPFKCFNIHKDLTEYLQRLIAQEYGIKRELIYPHLYDNSKQIKESVLNSIIY